MWRKIFIIAAILQVHWFDLSKSNGIAQEVNPINKTDRNVIQYYKKVVWRNINDSSSESGESDYDDPNEGGDSIDGSDSDADGGSYYNIDSSDIGDFSYLNDMQDYPIVFRRNLNHSEINQNDDPSDDSGSGGESNDGKNYNSHNGDDSNKGGDSNYSIELSNIGDFSYLYGMQDYTKVFRRKHNHSKSSQNDDPIDEFGSGGESEDGNIGDSNEGDDSNDDCYLSNGGDSRYRRDLRNKGKPKNNSDSSDSSEPCVGEFNDSGELSDTDYSSDSSGNVDSGDSSDSSDGSDSNDIDDLNEGGGLSHKSG